MKKITLITLILSILLIGAACSNGIENNSEEASSKSLVNAIQWNGETFVNLGNNVTGELIGIKLGETTFKYEGSNKDVNYQLQDGDAVLLEPGTMIYEVTGSENIAVKGEGGWNLYEKLNK